MNPDDLQLPAPLVPADCDLRDFAFMPLDVVRLRDSDLAVTAEADEFRCAVLLWCASWHQVPAASLPDDDKILAQYAGYGRVVKEWLKVREGALRGWVKCADGRLYHAVVAEKANEAWLAKLRQRLKTECSRIKKHNERHPGADVPFPEFDAWMEAGCPTGQPLFVPSDNPPKSPGQGGNVSSEKHSKGQGEGQGQGQLTSKTLSSSSQASTEVGADQQLDDDDHPRESKRVSAIVAMLRGENVEATSGDAIVLTWATDPRVTKDVLTAALARARQFKPGEPIGLAYLDKAVQSVLQKQSALPTAPPVLPQPFQRKPQGNDPKGTDESYDEWQARVAAYEQSIRTGGRAA
jgi:hypothetical protein